MPPWFPNVALLFGSTMLALGVAEFATRALFAGSVVLFPRNFAVANYDGVTLRRLTPNSIFRHTSIDGNWEFRTNAQGFRDDEDYRHAKPPGQYRILVLGDSHTLGYEARQSHTFSELLKQRLRRNNIDAQVLNTGISGFGTAEQLMFLEHEGMKYHPDAIVLAFFENDFDDSVKSDLYRLQNGDLVVNKTRHTPGVTAIELMNSVPGARWLSENSYLFSVLVNSVWEAAKTALSANTRTQIATEYAIRISEVSRYEKDLVIAIMRRMRNLAHSMGVRLIILELPAVDGSGRLPWQPSIPPELVPAITGEQDTFIPARSYLDGAEAGTVHVPNGHRHISEQTHARIAQMLHKMLSRTPSPGARPELVSPLSE